MPRFTLDQLLVLDAIVRTGSFAAAARELHRVPSAVSYAVKTLEEALGVPLFDRSGHRAELTPAGRRVLEAGGQLLRQARALQQLALDLSDGWEPELQVVVDGALPMAPVTRALAALVEQAVPTRVRVHVEFQDGVMHRFAQDSADMMLTLEFEGDGRLSGQPLGELDMVLVAAAGHPLHSGEQLAREALDAQVEVVVRDSSPRYARTPREPFMGSQHVLYLSDFHSKRLALLAGAGFGWLPLHLAREDLERGALCLLPLPERNTWTYHPHLMTRGDQESGRAGRLFRQVLVQQFGEKI